MNKLDLKGAPAVIAAWKADPNASTKAVSLATGLSTVNVWAIRRAMGLPSRPRPLSPENHQLRRARSCALGERAYRLREGGRAWIQVRDELKAKNISTVYSAAERWAEDNAQVFPPKVKFRAPRKYPVKGNPTRVRVVWKKAAKRTTDSRPPELRQAVARAAAAARWSKKERSP